MDIGGQILLTMYKFKEKYKNRKFYILKMAPFDYNLSKDDLGQVKADFYVNSRDELNELEKTIIYKIFSRGEINKKAVLINCKRAYGESKVPVKCCGLFLPPVPNAWLPYYVRSMYGDLSGKEDYELPSTVDPVKESIVEKGLRVKDESLFKPKRREIEKKMLELLYSVFDLDENEDRHLLVVKAEGDPISWNDFHLLLILKNSIEKLRVTGFTSGMHIYICEHDGIVKTRQISLKREFLKVDYSDKRKKLGRTIIPSYIAGSHYVENGIEQSVSFNHVTNLEFLFA